MAQFNAEKVVLKFLDWLESSGRTVNSKNISGGFIHRVVVDAQAPRETIDPEKLSDEIVRALGLDGTVSLVGGDRNELRRIIGKEKQGIL